MATLTKQYIEDHLADMHTEESWARATIETVLKAAITKLGEQSAEEVTIDAQFHVRPVDLEIVGPDGASLRRGCLRVCVVVSPTGLEICYHKEAVK
jgi:hypothetical protein